MSGEGLIPNDPERMPQPVISPAEQMDRIMSRGMGACMCSISTIRRVIMDHGTCGGGGCPYGGDF